MAFGSAIKKSNISENWLFDFYNQDSYLSFDGTNDYIDLGYLGTDIEKLNISSDTGISISFWFSFPTLGVSEIIFASHDNHDHYAGYWIVKDSNNKISFNWGHGSAGTGEGGRETRLGNTVLAANTWYFVVITSTFAHSTAVGSNIYINGTTPDTITASGTANVATPTYISNTVDDGVNGKIGGEIFGADSNGEFKLRNLGIWAGILATNDISVIYNSGKYYNLAEASGNYASADVDKLKAYWQFNNGITATDFINDISGKVHGATYNGSGLHLAFKDTSYDSNFYHGVIKNKPSIRESINLSNSTSSRSNLSVDIPDFKYKGSPISEELFGSNVYLNHDVRVYSQIDGDTPELIGSYRLSDISTNGESLTLSLKTFNPWDNISFPQNKHEDYNIYEPTVYGNFVAAKTSAATIDNNQEVYGVMGTVYPVPVLEFTSKKIYTLMPRAYVAADLAYIHLHAGFDAQFVPLRLHDTVRTTDGSRIDSTTYSDDGSGLNVLAARTSQRISSTTYKSAFAGLITTAVTDRDYSGVTQWSDQHNMFKWKPDNSLDTTVGATALYDSADDLRYLMVKTPKKRFHNEYVYKFLANITVTATDGSLGNAQGLCWDAFSNRFDSTADDLVNQTSDANFKRWYNGSLGSGTEAYSTESGTIEMGLDAGNSIDSQHGCMCPDELLIKAYTSDDTVGTSSGSVWDGSISESSTFTINSLQLYYVAETPENDGSDDAEKDIKELQSLKYFYCGADGLKHGITGLSGDSITEIHETHLDLMNRFAGLDVATNPATNIEGWGNGSDNLLDHVKDWKIRYWQLEPTSLTKTLEKLQYEGGFIFRFRRGDLTQPEYIFIRDTYSAVDFSDISKYDLSDVEIKPDSFSSVVTKMDINYQKHPDPSERKHLFLKNCENNSAKAEYVINSKENKKEVKLDAYVYPEIPAVPASNPNDDFYTYYNNINGEVKLNISGTFVNPKYYSINVGNTVTFSDSLMYPEKAYGKAFTDVIFMITSITRSVGSIKFTAREIGSL